MEPSRPPTSTNLVVNARRSCVKCGYSVEGLFASGHCPECGTPVADSLRGDLLQHASGDYLKTILTGHSWVLNGVLAMVIMQVVVVLVPLALATGRAGPPSREFLALSALAGLAVSTWIFLGYVKLTEPDPQFTGLDHPDTARRLVRLGAMVSIGVGAVSSGTLLVTTMSAATTIVLGMLQLVGLAAFAVQFFAMMNYTMWLARRIPDAWMLRRAAMYRWLLPLIAAVGALVLFLGPLVAMVMYWNLLDRMRKHLRSIVANGQPADLKGMMA